MKKIITFEKKIDFPSMIGEVTAISLDHNLHLVDDGNIEGEFKVYGKYKLTEASRLEEEFNYLLPVSIMLTEKLELGTVKIDIDDFSYEIENDDVMICNISVKVEGVEKIEEIEVEDVRECDNDPIEEKEVEIPVINDEEDIEEIAIDNQEENDYKSSIFSSFNDTDETYSTYSVYILREDNTIQSIMEKYKISREELEAYNNLDNLSVGDKIIIPMVGDE